MQPIRRHSNRRPGPSAPDTHGSYPLLGIAATLGGMGLALLFVPNDPEPKGVLAKSALCMAGGLLVAPVAAAWQDPRRLLRAEHVLALAPIYWLLLDLIQGAYDLEFCAREDARNAFIAIAVFVVGIWSASLHRAWRVPSPLVRIARVPVSAATMFGIAVLAFALCMFKFALPCHFNPMTMMSYVGAARWAAPWGRGDLGGWDAFTDHLQYFGYLLPALVIVLARKTGWLSFKTFLTLVMGVIVLLFLSQSGGRRIIGVVGGIALIVWVTTEKRVRWRTGVVALCSVGIMLAWMQFMINYRDAGLITVLDKEERAEKEKVEYLHVDDNFLRVSQIVHLIPEVHPYAHLEYIWFVLIRPVPRVFWPGKPTGVSFDLPTQLGMTGVSLSSSVVGELYLSGGFIALLIGGWFYGRLTGMADRLLAESTDMSGHVMYGSFTMAIFAGVRSMQDLVLMSYVVLAFVALVWLRDRISGKAPARAAELNSGRMVSAARRGATPSAQREVPPV